MDRSIMMPPRFQLDTSYLRLPGAFYHQAIPSPVPNPSLVVLNHDLAKRLGVSFEEMPAEKIAQLLAGNLLPEEATPLAMAYAGHQFGHFTLLGDGRAHLLGEHVAPDGSRWDLHYKGSGPTPFSRRGDGRAALGPMLREYLISEAMHALGIPSTRSLSVVETGATVQRETPLKGAVLLRVAASHLRVGTFQWAAAQSKLEWIRQLMDYTIQRHYPECQENPHPARSLLEHFMQRQIDLIVDWMRVGFIHGVMNTDNMALSGETIDYGPCAFLEDYHPETVFSSIDRGGRYAFGNQPKVAWWNIARFAETLLPQIQEEFAKAIEVAEEIIGSFTSRYDQAWLGMMRRKLGLVEEDSGDLTLIQSLLEWMQQSRADYTLTFARLTYPEAALPDAASEVSQSPWFDLWKARLSKESQDWEASKAMMESANPGLIPRNHLVEQALQAAESGEMQPFENLCQKLRSPYAIGDLSDPCLRPALDQERVRHTFCGT